jgi:hypothetical protein
MPSKAEKTRILMSDLIADDAPPATSSSLGFDFAEAKTKSLYSLAIKSSGLTERRDDERR